MRLSDILGVFKSTKLKLVSKKHLTGDIYLFDFSFEGKMNWKAGQHGVFQFKGEKMEGNNYRLFSITTSCNENKISIGTRIGDNPSAFKAKLRDLEIGAAITLKGPFGRFYITDYTKPLAMIAGGIGITPIRALLKDIDEKGIASRGVEVFFMDDKGEYAFEEEIKHISSAHDFIQIHFLKSREDFNSALNTFVEKYHNDAYYYISGSPKMIEGVKGKLTEKDIASKQVIHDEFRGY